MNKIIQFPTTVENIQRLMLNNPNDGLLSEDGLFPMNKNKVTSENTSYATHERIKASHFENKDNWRV